MTKQSKDLWIKEIALIVNQHVKREETTKKKTVYPVPVRLGQIVDLHA